MNRFLQLGVNKHGRDFVIGDIHGKYYQLMRGLERIEFDKTKDRLIAVGDLIDRGKENMQVLELIGEPWFYTVIGNHEVMMLRAIKDGSTIVPYARDQMAFWTTNGGHWYYTIDDEDIAQLKDTYCDLIEYDLPVAIEFIAENGKRVGVTHGGLPRAWTWDQVRVHLKDVLDINDKALQECLWTRTRVRETGFLFDILGVDLLVNGHTPSKKEVWRGGNNVFIDLGTHNPYQLVPINVMDLFDRLENNYE